MLIKKFVAEELADLLLQMRKKPYVNYHFNKETCKVNIERLGKWKKCEMYEVRGKIGAEAEFSIRPEYREHATGRRIFHIRYGNWKVEFPIAEEELEKLPKIRELTMMEEKNTNENFELKQPLDDIIGYLIRNTENIDYKITYNDLHETKDYDKHEQPTEFIDIIAGGKHHKIIDNYEDCIVYNGRVELIVLENEKEIGKANFYFNPDYLQREKCDMTIKGFILKLDKPEDAGDLRETLPVALKLEELAVTKTTKGNKEKADKRIEEKWESIVGRRKKFPKYGRYGCY